MDGKDGFETGQVDVWALIELEFGEAATSERNCPRPVDARTIKMERFKVAHGRYNLHNCRTFRVGLEGLALAIPRLILHKRELERIEVV
jgi:hypothetical protein